MTRRNIAAATIVFGLSGAANIASAQAPEAGVGIVRLSDAERADLLSHNTETSVDAARSGLGDAPRLDRQVHGEVGTAIGSHGYRSIYGAASVPLGESAGAAVSFESDRFDTRR